MPRMLKTIYDQHRSAMMMRKTATTMMARTTKMVLLVAMVWARMTIAAIMQKLRTTRIFSCNDNLICFYYYAGLSRQLVIVRCVSLGELVVVVVVVNVFVVVLVGSAGCTNVVIVQASKC